MFESWVYADWYNLGWYTMAFFCSASPFVIIAVVLALTNFRSKGV